MKSIHKGRVVLVGAGPGDVGLLTLKGKAAIEEADVVVYDRLVGPDILALIPSGCRKINVGKAASNHLIPQEEINQILLEEAQSGKVVVRLKGGDPFLFGRGGEELELLAEHGVSFQEIPGIPSAIAVPAYAGIPVTHRDCCSSLHIVTGHARKGKPLDINFQALVESRGTLVFLMGVSALEEICQGLLLSGMSPSMACAVVEKGTTPRQRRISASLGELSEKARACQVESPAIIIIGEVCKLAEGFDWFSTLPLYGTSVVVTRPQERVGTLSTKLRNLGSEVIEYPCIETREITPNLPLDRAMNDLASYQWLVLTSPAGVEALWHWVSAQGKNARLFSGVKLAVVGPSTQGALSQFGLLADLMPEVYDSQHLGEALSEVATGKVLLLRAQEGSPDLSRPLSTKGIPFEEVAIYTTHYENPISQQLISMMNQSLWVTFTSASTVKGFVSSVGENVDFSKVQGICIGVQTSAESKKWGISTRISDCATIDSMIDCLCQSVAEQKK